jgi:carbon storage regulator
MLVLSRKVGERIQIGDHVTVTVVQIYGNGVRLGIDAPSNMLVVREELMERERTGVCDRDDPPKEPIPS